MSDVDRREQVLVAALATFARYGYRKTSMDDVARAADISRPGLYFLFSAKQALFQAAITQALERDLAAASRALASSAPLSDRLVEAFDLWTGRYVGPMAEEVPLLMASNPELLGPIVTEYPGRFLALVAAVVPDEAARTLVSTAIGIKQDAASREEFVTRFAVAVRLYLD